MKTPIQNRDLGDEHEFTGNISHDDALKMAHGLPVMPCDHPNCEQDDRAGCNASDCRMLAE